MNVGTVGTSSDAPMRFGIFLAPFHPTGQNPTLALERDLDLVQWLDQLGYDEAWIEEHHSGGHRYVIVTWDGSSFGAGSSSARASSDSTISRVTA